MTALSLRHDGGGSLASRQLLELLMKTESIIVSMMSRKSVLLGAVERTTGSTRAGIIF